ncbi:MAG: PepSY-associated TM helix domain-containing protein [Candidatus Cyclobacteriaceae bacterium M2_1C_046]
MNLRKHIRKIHLWLGFLTGPVVFIIAITGCIYVFQEEIQGFTQPYRFISSHSAKGNLLPPSELKSIAEEVLPGKNVQRIYYEEDGRAAFVRFMSADYYYLVYINPYTGVVQKVKNMYNDFFYNVFRLHVHLLLPQEIGKKIVSISTLIFLGMLISGLILWWPKSRNKRKSSFTIKTDGSKKRLNYDLHNVLGFYATWIVIFAAVTGLVWGFQWFGKTTYWLTSGGKHKPDLTMPASNTTVHQQKAYNALDSAFHLSLDKYPDRPRYIVFLPADSISAIGIAANPSKSTYYKSDYTYYDQHSLKVLKRPVYGRYEEASIADKALRMNYDIHVGSIGGMPGKFILFFVSLITASLPVTGFIIWYKRKYKKRRLRPATEFKGNKRLSYARQDL